MTRGSAKHAKAHLDSGRVTVWLSSKLNRLLDLSTANTRRAAGGLFAVTGAGVTAALLLGSPNPTVTLNNRAVSLGEAHSSVSDVMRSVHDRLPFGILYSVVDHRVLNRRDLSIPPVITVDGRRAAPNAIVVAGDRIGVRPGSAVEPTVTRFLTQAPMQPVAGGASVEPVLARPVIGLGAGLPAVERALWHLGRPAGRVAVMGALSGEVLSEGPLLPPAPPMQDGRKVVALSFDDGPDPRWTPQILAILRAEDIHATFCLIGREVLRYPNLVKQEVADGNTVCDHTVDHDEHLNVAPQARVTYEIDHGADIVAAAAGVEPAFYRPPGGTLSPQIIATAHRRGLRVLYWSVDSNDYLAPPAAVTLLRVLSKSGPGAILLFHDGGGDRSQTVAVLKPLIDTLRNGGYSFITPAQETPTPLLGEPVPPTVGTPDSTNARE